MDRKQHSLHAAAFRKPTIALLACALAPVLCAGLSPTPVGGYNDGTTAGGDLVFQALIYGQYNTAFGNSALKVDTNGSKNTALGASTLTTNTVGFENTAVGSGALYYNTTGSDNTGSGFNALAYNTTGTHNEASGMNALIANTTGSSNTAAGSTALSDNTTGTNNIGLGAAAGSALTTGNNNIDIGALGTAGESNTIRIGKGGLQKTAFMQGIYGSPVSGGQQVYVNSAGKLGVVTASSARFKEAVRPMADASEAILGLHPVTFRYKEELDVDQASQFGLIAEQVEKVDADLVYRGPDGKVDGVRYEAVNAMLLNEFLKEHRKVGEQQAAIARLQEEQAKVGALTSALARQQAQIDALEQALRKRGEPR